MLLTRIPYGTDYRIKCYLRNNMDVSKYMLLFPKLGCVYCVYCIDKLFKDVL